MELDIISRWLSIIALLISIGSALWAWLGRSGRELRERITKVRAAGEAADKALGDELDIHDRRIQLIESELKHLPSKEDVADLKLAMTEMNGKLKVSENELSSVGRTVRRIEEHMLGVRQ